MTHDDRDSPEFAATVYAELRRLAHRHLLRERAGHTLSTTALVHEAYLKLGDQKEFADRTHFLAVAAMAMRRILINYARDRAAVKRGGNARPVTLDDEVVPGDRALADVIALDDLLDRLATLSERQARIVIYRFYGGLTEMEIAAAIGVSEGTVRREWRAARAWLHRELERARRLA